MQKVALATLTLAEEAYEWLLLVKGQYEVKDCPKAKQKGASSSSGSVKKPNTKATTEKEPMTQGRVFALIPGEARNTETVVSGTLSICTRDAYALIDSGSTHSFISRKFVNKLDKKLEPLEYLLLMSTSSGESMICTFIYQDGDIVVGSASLTIDLLPIDMEHFDVILGID
ncbi:uncharacterized protein LOC114319492 [Camellia sinensis]|uniref:uncharacterized protein LOC114319492 n=1 Tax=Camellia sinensis TaxID=4442 RepID=UPI00103660E6|nr:uncharacterized protein LOC114319492 [Camellia sinensis]